MIPHQTVNGFKVYDHSADAVAKIWISQKERCKISVADGIFLAAAVQIMDQNVAPLLLRIADLVEIDPVLQSFSWKKDRLLLFECLCLAVAHGLGEGLIREWFYQIP